MADLDTKTEYIPKIVREMMMPSSLNVIDDGKCEKCRCNKYCGLVNTCEMTKEVYETGVKDFAKFLIDKGIDKFEMPDLVAEFLEKGE